MTTAINKLDWVQATGPNRACLISLDTTNETDWEITLNGTDETSTPVTALYVIVDNFKNSQTCTMSYGPFRYYVGPYTRKTFPIIYQSPSFNLNAVDGVVDITLCNFNPGIPDDTNQVAANGASDDPTTVWDKVLATGGVQISIGSTAISNDTTGGVQGSRVTDGYLGGLFYVEFIFAGDTGVVKNWFGLTNEVLPFLLEGQASGGAARSIACNTENGGIVMNGVGVASCNVSFNANGMAAMAVNLDTRRIWFGRIINVGTPIIWNGNASYDPATGVGGIDFSAIAAQNYYIMAGVRGGLFVGDGINQVYLHAGYDWLRPPPAGYLAWKQK